MPSCSFGIASRPTAPGIATLPSWIADLPLVGGLLANLWRGLVTNTGDLLGTILPYVTPLRDAAIRGGLGIGRGIIELAVSVLVAFFLYRDGALAAELLHRSIGSVVGDRAKHLIGVAAGTIRSVVYGVIGTAMIQAMLALVRLLAAERAAALPARHLRLRPRPLSGGRLLAGLGSGRSSGSSRPAS